MFTSEPIPKQWIIILGERAAFPSFPSPQSQILAFCLCIQLELFKPLGLKDLNFFPVSMQVQIYSVEKSPKLFQTVQWNLKTSEHLLGDEKGWEQCLAGR